MKEYIKKNWKMFLGAIVCIIAIPLIMDWFIIGNKIPSNIENGEWVGFLGSYIGAILGGTVTIVGVAITLKASDRDRKRDKIDEIRPYLVLEACSIGGCDKAKDYPIANNEGDSLGHYDALAVTFTITNVGLDSAVNIKCCNCKLVTAIQKSDSTKAIIKYKHHKGDKATNEVHIDIEYNDLRNNLYKQQMIFKIKKSYELSEFNINGEQGSPELI